MAMTSVDINCDMGEGFGHWQYGDAPDAALMAVISSANVAAGYHAGDPNIMDEVARLCAEHGVGLGAHPGYGDRQGFGRRVIDAAPAELVNDILYQTGAIREFGRRYGIPLRHVKPHGALYMTAANDAELSRLLVKALRKTDPDAALYCMGPSETFRIAQVAGQPTVRELFADRDYDASGQIVFARKMRRLDPQAVAEKCLRACTEGTVVTVDGETIALPFESICFHSDTPGALEIGTAIHETLTGAGITIAPPPRVAAAA
ncbi:5-oxoprolinase subunit PxpA [Acuticoccus sp. I52.16.1]|uniref:5-oxoprolinase subunit PxpA n=1 Tax=Acuticoccus sp. I52.16.1 TaxID=2928472 RepID=UPI001FD54FB1|nr:5-oxoprolinase subunit PxpA [Acuticoccus sp. I52.16.1]UOM35482.1 5-oxoprolinase subunit PxpA [Acuticoccus sp. I52.16.1]